MAMLPPVATLFIQSVVTGSLLLPWYAAPCVPAIAMMMSGMAEQTGRRRGPIFSVSVLTLIILASGHRIRSLLRSHEIEANRAATTLTRQVVNPMDPDYNKGVITVQFSCRRPGYDPGARQIDSAEELEMIQREALSTNSDLYVNIGDAKAARQRWPHLMKKLDNLREFELVSVLPGMDNAQTRMIWKAVR